MSHQPPAKAQQFLDIDLRSARESIAAPSAAEVGSLKYLRSEQAATKPRQHETV